MRGNIKILMVAAEVHPFAKTGGLADVSGSLPPALKKLGRADLIGPGKRHLVPARQPIGQPPSGRAFNKSPSDFKPSNRNRKRPGR